MVQDLRESHDGELFGAVPRLTTGRDHARPCDADEPNIGHALLDRTDEAGAKRVTRGLPGNHADPQHPSALLAVWGARLDHGWPVTAQSVVDRGNYRMRPRELARTDSRSVTSSA